MSNTNMRISLLFLTHNNFEKMYSGLRSYVPLLDRDDIVEMIILDNASTDIRIHEYLQSLAQHPKVNIIFSPINKGVASGRAFLFTRARGDVIMSLDSDAILYNTSFIDIATRVISNHDIGICGPIGSFFLSPRCTTHIDLNCDAHYEGDVHFISGCCQIFRRDLLDEIALDTSFSPFWYEDVDFSFQVKQNGKRVYRFDPQGTFFHAWGGGGRVFNEQKRQKRIYLLRKWKSFTKQLSIPKNVRLMLKKEGITQMQSRMTIRAYYMLDREVGRVGQYLNRTRPHLYHSLKRFMQRTPRTP